jgi:hypothetical protein
MAKWDIEQEKRPKNQRRPCPKPPAALAQLLEMGGEITHEEVHKANQQAYDQYDKESLYPCTHCGRTFGYDQLQRHKKVCTAERPMNKLNRPDASPTPSPGMNAKAGFGGSGGMGGGGDYTPPSKPAMAKPAPGGMGARPPMSQNPIDSKPIGGGSNAYPSKYDDEDDGGYGGGGTGNLVPCAKCGRNFAEDRIGKHQKACKANAKPKKVKMFHKPITEKEKAKMDAVKEKTSKWRQQHEDFVNAMKYNRQVSKVEQGGGDIRNMPPPPRSSGAGMTPCPYCGRNFGEVQAAKHIPACKNTVNKPKPPPGRAAPTTGGYGGAGAYGGSSSGMGGGYGAPPAKQSPGMSSGYGQAGRPAAPTKPAGPTGMSSGYGAAPTRGGLGAGVSGQPYAKPGNTGMGTGMGTGAQGSNYRKKF